MKYYKIKVLNHYTIEYCELIRKIKFEIDFREPYIDFKKDMIKTWEVPFQNQKMSENDKELIHTRVKDFLLGNFKSKVFYFED